MSWKRTVKALLGGMLLICLGNQIAWAQQEYLDLAEEYRQADLDARTDIEKYVYVDPPRGLQVSLMIINTSWREIDITLEARRADGTWGSIAEIPTEPRRSFAVSLPTDIVGTTQLLRIGYFDLPDGIGAQVQYSSPANQPRRETYAVPFLTPSPARNLIAAWAGESNESLEVAVVNPSEQAIEYQVKVDGTQHAFSMAAFETKRHRGNETSSIVQIDSDESDLLVWAHERGPGQALVSMPLFSESALSGAGFASTHIPNQGGQARTIEVTVANLSDESGSVPWFLIDNASGQVVTAKTVSLAPHEVANYDLTAEWSSIDDWSSYRLEAGPASTPFLAHGVVELPNGARTELSLQGLDSGHGSGRYPVPGVNMADSTLNLVNLGGETALVAGKLNWDGGELLVEPMEIPAKASTVVDVRSLVEENSSIPSDFSGGFFEWLTMQGSNEIIGRMEITMAGSRDPIGINCQQCCHEVPVGLIVPGSVTLTSAGQLKTFETDIKYNTCSGVTGPFYLPPDNLDFSSPFSWNSKKVSASADSQDELAFSGTALGMSLLCDDVWFPVSGSGLVDACELALISPCCKNNKCSIEFGGPTCSDQAKEGARHCQDCYCCCTARFRYEAFCEKRKGAGDNKRNCDHSCLHGACS